MTIEEKAKRYDESLGKVEELLSRCIDDRDRRTKVYRVEDIESIFPELKESEDEKIRKEFCKDIWSFIPNEKAHKYIAWLEKQGQEKTIDMSIKEKAHQIAWETSKHYDPLLSKESWCEMAALDMASWLEKQGEQKPNDKIESTDYNSIDPHFGKPIDKVEPKFKIKYAGSEYNVLEIKEIAGDTYYGIEDEPNHIDYVLPDNCEIVSEQKSSWSKEDEERLQSCLNILQAKGIMGVTKTINTKWLKSLKDRYTWKPSDEQLDALHDAAVYVDKSMFPYPKGILMKLYKQLKKLKGE